MLIEQTIDIPQSTTLLTVALPQPIPAGTATLRLELTPGPAKADPEPWPRVTRAEREERRKRRKDDPVWQVLERPLEHDSSWLPEGLTRETFLVKDVRDIIIKDKYGI